MSLARAQAHNAQSEGEHTNHELDVQEQSNLYLCIEEPSI